MKKWRRILFLFVMAGMLAGFALVEAAEEKMNIVKIRYDEGGGKVFIPEIHGMKDANTQDLVNARLKDAILARKNSAPNSSLNGDFTVSFYNENLLGIHFKGYSYSRGTAHPNKIDQGFHIDLTNGTIYKLADLFIAGTDVTGRIRSLCATNQEQYRLQVDGLWDGWKYEDFSISWEGEDAAFLLSDKTVRVYTIPSYAKGAISGYGIPYADMMELIDRNSSLWMKIQAKPMGLITIIPEP